MISLFVIPSLYWLYKKLFEWQPRSERMARRGFYLPSGLALKEERIGFVATQANRILKECEKSATTGIHTMQASGAIVNAFWLVHANVAYLAAGLEAAGYCVDFFLFASDETLSGGLLKPQFEKNVALSLVICVGYNESNSAAWHNDQDTTR